MSRSVAISEQEHLALLLEAHDGRSVLTSWGSTQVRLIVTDSNRWALRRLAEMRGVA